MTSQFIPSPPRSGIEPPSFDVDALEKKQQATWASGDFAVIGTTLQLVGETLCEAADVCSDERVLDVACGNGNATLAAARRFAQVTGIDYVPSLLERGRERAVAERLNIDFRIANANELPFEDGSFDAVLSTFGVMFSAKPDRAARELLRVCRPGGRIALANWTPEGFIGKLLQLVSRFVPPPAGAPSPLRWGSRAGLAELFGERADIAIQRRNFAFRYRSEDHFIDVFRTYYGPTHKAFAALPEPAQRELSEQLGALLRSQRGQATAGLVVPAEYLEVIVRV
jgi:SAM-dependent methyltransferase